MGHLVWWACPAFSTSSSRGAELDEMITRRGRLEDISEVFRALSAGEVARMALVFELHALLDLEGKAALGAPEIDRPIRRSSLVMWTSFSFLTGACPHTYIRYIIGTSRRKSEREAGRIADDERRPDRIRTHFGRRSLQ